jgi:uridine kinase
VFDDILLVGVAGGTASGKTTIAARVAQILGSACVLISHDRYYRDVTDPESFNYDHPDALDTERLVDDLRGLQTGDATLLPDYDFKTHTRRPVGELVQPAPVVLVEGILVFEHEELRELFDLKVWVETPDDLRLVRRIRRDVAERGRALDSVLQRWLSTVRPMHMQYVQPSTKYADLHLTGVGLIEPLVDMTLSAIERAQRERQQHLRALPDLKNEDTCAHLFDANTLDPDDLQSLDMDLLVPLDDD